MRELLCYVHLPSPSKLKILRTTLSLGARTMRILLGLRLDPMRMLSRLYSPVRSPPTVNMDIDFSNKFTDTASCPVSNGSGRSTSDEMVAILTNLTREEEFLLN